MHFTDAATELLSTTVDGTEHGYEATVDTDGDGINDSGHWDNPHGDTPPGGASTIDSDGDGLADTEVTHTADNGTVLITDIDGDGSADVVTEIDGAGEFTTYEYADDHTWQATGHGSLTEGAPAAAPAGHAVIDPATGEWIQR